MLLNGERVRLDKEQSLYDFLRGLDYNIDRIAVELNYEIIPREKFREVVLTEADVMEVVTFMGGG